MPNIKSAKKRVKVTKVKALNNQAAKSALKTVLKKFDAAIVSGDKAAAEAAYKAAVKAVDKAASTQLADSSIQQNPHPVGWGFFRIRMLWKMGRKYRRNFVVNSSGQQKKIMVS